jgi:hypothetical protein
LDLEPDDVFGKIFVDLTFEYGIESRDRFDVRTREDSFGFVLEPKYAFHLRHEFSMPLQNEIVYYQTGLRSFLKMIIGNTSVGMILSGMNPSSRRSTEMFAASKHFALSSSNEIAVRALRTDSSLAAQPKNVASSRTLLRKNNVCNNYQQILVRYSLY